jgi:von Willebrand factor type A domain
MLRPTIFCAAILGASAIATLALAEKTDVVITVEKSKPAAPATAPFQGTRPSVDVALLLDTSNSMDGLINQAKTQLWTIVQQFAKAKKHGQTPVLRVALFEYGNNSLPAAEGYIRQVVPLSDDLDKLSEALFALSTNGGDEYCGQVIDQAITRLDWSHETNGYKAIFIAGNEPFTQGPVDYRQACRRAIEHGIVVNTIHCGTRESGVQGHWADGAQLAEGDFFNIDQDRAVVHVKCPQDEIIIRLNAELNKTYLWYGAADERRHYATNQVAQDVNAKQAGAAAARVVTKASDAYSNRNRDLVDTLQADGEILGRLKKEELPEALQNMTPEKREQYVKQMAAKRADIQKQIGALGAQREAYLAQKRAEAAADAGQATLGDAVVSTIQKQLKETGFDVSGSGK